MRSIRQALFASVVMLCYPGAHAAAQESGEALECLSMGRVRDIEVVDDDRILFYQGGQRVYLNVLERTCEGLKRDGAFTWRNGRGTVRNPRLCRADFISVLDWGRLGSACKLGAFRLISNDHAKELLSNGPGGSEKSESAKTPNPATND
jgi:hypothetical protein